MPMHSSAEDQKTALLSESQYAYQRLFAKEPCLEKHPKDYESLHRSQQLDARCNHVDQSLTTHFHVVGHYRDANLRAEVHPYCDQWLNFGTSFEVSQNYEHQCEISKC